MTETAINRLRVRAADFIDNSIEEPVIKKKVLQTLGDPGKILALPESAIFSWSSALLAVAAALGPVTNTALDCALALDLFVTAADIFDDLADQDNKETAWSAFTTGEQLCIAMLLWQFSQNILDKLEPQKLGRQIKARFSTAATRSCMGQSRDVFNLAPHSLEQCYEFTEQKSGSLVALCFSLGALSVEAETGLVDALAEIGSLFGIVNQLSNDIRGVAQPEVKSDIRLRKITMPAAFCLYKTNPSPLLRYFYLQNGHQDTLTVSSLIVAEGGLLYTQEVIAALKEEIKVMISRLSLGLKEREQIETILFPTTKA